MARILKLKELKTGMVVWLQESHLVEPHVAEIISIKKGENYFDQKCMEVNFSIPFTRLFTFLPLETIMMIMVTLGFAGIQNRRKRKINDRIKTMSLLRRRSQNYVWR